MSESIKLTEREKKIKDLFSQLADCITDDADLIKAVELVRGWAKETKVVESKGIKRNQPVYSIPAMLKMLKKDSDLKKYFKVKKEVAPVSYIDEFADSIIKNANRRIKRKEEKTKKESEE